MTCYKASDCGGCADCAETTPPVMPRCDVVLTDGVYTNATVTVENGCITQVNGGRAPLYQPDSCCALPGSGGGGGDGLDGDPGPAGQNATIEIGSVSGTAPGTVPTVTNVGTPTHAILAFTFPRGEPGESATGVTGATSTASGVSFENGLLQEPLPPQWGPVLDIRFTPSNVDGVEFTAEKDDSTGVVTVGINLDEFVSNVEAEITGLQQQIDELMAQMAGG